MLGIRRTSAITKEQNFASLVKRVNNDSYHVLNFGSIFLGKSNLYLRVFLNIEMISFNFSNLSFLEFITQIWSFVNFYHLYPSSFWRTGESLPGRGAKKFHILFSGRMDKSEGAGMKELAFN